MKTELKDVIHFYLGCQAQKMTNDGIVTDEISGYTIAAYPSNMPTYWVKPILRHLSDMDSEEMLECYNFCWNDHDISYTKKINHIRKAFDSNETEWMGGNLVGNCRVFLWATRNGFDLFGLIESGQAIDKTTLK